MKKSILALGLVAVLAGCEDASKMIDQAQEAANQAVDSVQAQVESLDLADLNLDQFGEAAESAEVMTTTLNEIINADFSNPVELTEVTDKFANAYQCLVDATSESSAQQLLDKVMATITNQEAQSLIEKGLEKAERAQACVM